MTKILIGIVLSCAAGVNASADVAQEPARMTVLTDVRQPKTFVRTPEGDWETTIRTADGRTHTFVFVPPNKVDPRVRTDIALLTKGPTLSVRYSYVVANGPRASQELAMLFMRGVRPSEVKTVPVGWTLVAPPSPGNLAFTGAAAGKYIRGIAPNSQAEWSVESAALPGVIRIQSMGATADGAQVTVPPGLTADQRADLEQLSRDVTIDSPALGPAIAVGIGEPELSFATVLTRVLTHYRDELRRYDHPEAPAVARLADSIGGRDEVTLQDPAVRAALNELAALSRKPSGDEWHRQLSMALSVCVDALLTGALPTPWRPSAVE